MFPGENLITKEYNFNSNIAFNLEGFRDFKSRMGLIPLVEEFGDLTEVYQDTYENRFVFRMNLISATPMYKFCTLIGSESHVFTENKGFYL